MNWKQVGVSGRYGLCLFSFDGAKIKIILIRTQIFFHKNHQSLQKKSVLFKYSQFNIPEPPFLTSIIQKAGVILAYLFRLQIFIK